MVDCVKIGCMLEIWIIPMIRVIIITIIIRVDYLIPSLMDLIHTNNLLSRPINVHPRMVVVMELDIKKEAIDINGHRCWWCIP